MQDVRSTWHSSGAAGNLRVELSHLCRKWRERLSRRNVRDSERFPAIKRAWSMPHKLSIMVMTGEKSATARCRWRVRLEFRVFHLWGGLVKWNLGCCRSGEKNAREKATQIISMERVARTWQQARHLLPPAWWWKKAWHCRTGDPLEMKGERALNSQSRERKWRLLFLRHSSSRYAESAKVSFSESVASSMAARLGNNSRQAETWPKTGNRWERVCGDCTENRQTRRQPLARRSDWCRSSTNRPYREEFLSSRVAYFRVQ